ncbi:hypothetical protein AAH979_33745 [Plantactinospora sp. ZYX-F-223]|uniref:hypothetical protein n=1 Tax=Plantactinospora sp. ZYX-F-223 TaxID=3144103 RepID=UPI0031FDE021
MVLAGDATHLPDVLPSVLRGRVALVVTSPPYGATLRSRVANRPRRVALDAGLTAVPAGCVPLLRPWIDADGRGRPDVEAALHRLPALGWS